MRLARKIPDGGALPELHTYDCKECGIAVTEAGGAGPRLCRIADYLNLLCCEVGFFI